ncbi:hypothetical protein AADZ84_11075 [Colwelliaceae bacterium MEBiC 14330]
MNIISHRGYWKIPREKNMQSAFQRSLERGFGIETDLRDYNGEIVISHDMADKNSMLFSDFMKLVNRYRPVVLALNIKADGLQKKVFDVLAGYESYFVFDMSVPDALGYQKQGITNYTRFSDIEPEPALLLNAKGVWLDNFKDNLLDIKALKTFLNEGKQVALVSPELHKFDHIKYWRELKNYFQSQPEQRNNISICTDFPEEAQGFFNE